MGKNKRPVPSEPEQAAGNGLLDRHLFLTGTAAAIGNAAMANHASAAEALPFPREMIISFAMLA